MPIKTVTIHRTWFFKRNKIFPDIKIVPSYTTYRSLFTDKFYTPNTECSSRRRLRKGFKLPETRRTDNKRARLCYYSQRNIRYFFNTGLLLCGGVIKISSVRGLF